MSHKELMTIDAFEPFEVDSATDIFTRFADSIATGEDDRARVLHVDDEPDYVELAATFLERFQDDFTVVPETDPRAALSRLDEESFDCIISDYQMPVMDGIDLLREVRENHPDIPFILCTARGSEEIASCAITAGVTDYIQKGTDTNQYEVLANRVQNAIDQYRTRQQLWDTLSWSHTIMTQQLVGVCVIRDGSFVFANGRFAEVVGHSPDDLVGRSPACFGLGALLEENDETPNELATEAAPAPFLYQTGHVGFKGKNALLGLVVEAPA